MSKIAKHVIHQVIEKSDDSDWVNSLADNPELATAVVSNPLASSETLHKIANTWTNSNLDHPHYRQLTKAVRIMTGDPYAHELSGEAYSGSLVKGPHINLHSDTRKLISNSLSHHLAAAGEELRARYGRDSDAYYKRSDRVTYLFDTGVDLSNFSSYLSKLRGIRRDG